MSASDDMRALLGGLYDAFGNGDASAFLNSLAEDAVGIGTDEAEFWVGGAVIGPIVRQQVTEMSGAGIRVTPGEPMIGESGDAVWAVDRPTLHLPDGSSSTLRATLLATRDGDRIVVRQMHVSVGAPNAEVVQRELTTE